MLADLPIIDVDSHVTEPPDLWTARLPAKWHVDAPRVVRDERRDFDRWIIGDKRLPGVANSAAAGWRDYPPSFPPVLAEADPASWQPKARLERMDEYGISAQALYPNLLGFHNDLFMKMEAELGLACVAAYNDFLTEFAAVAPERFIALTAIPFWDIEASVGEMARCAEAGHRGLLLASSLNFERVGLPPLHDAYWAPVLRLAAELDWTINFHVGFARPDDDYRQILRKSISDRAEYGKTVALGCNSCIEGVADLVMSGLCHTYPTLRFVSVESGAGWIPFLMEALDWQWRNSGAARQYPEREVPSFYFRRQVYGSFWFEQETIRSVLEIVGDNVMFETDFPHPTSLSPGPANHSKPPREMAAGALRDVPEAQVRKVLYETAARLYHVDVDAITPAAAA